VPTTTSTRTASSAYTPVVAAPRLRDENGVRFGLAHAGLVVAALLAAVTQMPGSLSLTVIAVAAVASGRGLPVHSRAGIALAAWAIWTGFLENTLGVLTFSGADLARLATLVVLAVVRLGP
jgi:hypothetical protein